MDQERQRTRIAVLIDADNASPRHANALFAEIAKLGEAIVRRVYGDFGSQGLKGWNDQLPKHALVPVQTVSYTKGKNASDISLVIDAMDLMHQKLYDAFCIVSSDSDFTRLAQRLRESGAEVYGFGEKKTPDSFRQSCRRFFLIENLARDQAIAEKIDEPELIPVEEIVESPQKALPVIIQAYEMHIGESSDGWVPIRQMQKTILNLEADFDTRTYGEHRLGDLSVKTGYFELQKRPGHSWSIKKKAQNKSSTVSKETKDKINTRPKRGPMAKALRKIQNA